ncbi:MAG: shikimate dehydrogenase [Actinomycetota bacterium]|jgi:shikimate dehydrogenase
MNRRVSGTTKVAAVVGWPIAHSLSPTIHNVGFDSTGVDWTYVALGVHPERGDTILSSCRALGIRGLSVTMPFKTVLAAQVERLDDTCRRLGSLNTISFDDHGSTTGHSTDGDGLIASLLASDVEFGAQRLLVLGTGGAGRSVIEAASRSHPRSLLVSNRTAPDRELISSISSGMAEIVPWDDRSSALREVDIVINCTSIGMGDDRHLPFDPNAIGPAHVVVELIYHPIRTALMDAAQTRGARVVGGLGMLIHQAALQQQIWTGHLPDVEAMTRSALSALGERR